MPAHKVVSASVMSQAVARLHDDLALLTDVVAIHTRFVNTLTAVARMSVADFARTAAAENVAPERMLVALKDALAHAEGINRLPIDVRSQVLQQLVVCAVQAYFRERK